MTRSDLVEELAAHFNQLSQADAEYAVKVLLESMGDALEQGHRIEIRGFGSFTVNRRAPRTARNPRNGQTVQVPEKRVLHFKPGKALREAVDQAGEPAAGSAAGSATGSAAGSSAGSAAGVATGATPGAAPHPAGTAAASTAHP